MYDPLESVFLHGLLGASTPEVPQTMGLGLSVDSRFDSSSLMDFE